MAKWTEKRRRQYEHIKESAKSRGASASRAKEIAGRTVNKTRRQRGETPSKTTQGAGNPNISLSDHSKQELMNRAREMDIPGRSKMNKGQLVKAIKGRRRS